MLTRRKYHSFIAVQLEEEMPIAVYVNAYVARKSGVKDNPYDVRTYPESF